MRDFNQELKARTRLHNIVDGVWLTLGFICMFFLLFWMATTI